MNMKTTLKTTIVIAILFAFNACFANDGAYYVSGNHLIPMYESDIVVKKEILTIKRAGAMPAFFYSRIMMACPRPAAK